MKETRPMSYERDEAARQQDATEAMIRMREPLRSVPLQPPALHHHIAALRARPDFDMADRYDAAVHRLRETFENMSAATHSPQQMRELHRRDGLGIYVHRDQQAAWRGFVEGFIIGASLPLGL